MLRPSTIARYTDAVATISAVLGDYYVDALGPRDVERFVGAMKREGYAPATINGWLNVLRSIARDVERDLDVRYFARGVSSLPVGRTRGPRGTSLTPDQFRAFLGVLGAIPSEVLAVDIARALATLAWTGLRAGELLALRWQDYRGGELHVDRAVWRGHVGPTKTNDPRAVVVVEPLAAVLQEQRDWLLHEQHAGLRSGLAFPADPQHARGSATRRKGPVQWYRSRSTLTEGLQVAVVAGGLPLISLHSLRRTYEDLLRRAGVDQMVRRSLAGWRSEAAQAIYAGVDSADRAAAGAAVVEFVMGGGA